MSSTSFLLVSLILYKLRTCGPDYAQPLITCVCDRASIARTGDITRQRGDQLAKVVDMEYRKRKEPVVRQVVWFSKAVTTN